jgi:hypothetical protein
VAKFSANKGTLAGVHQVFRKLDQRGLMERDAIGLHDEALAGHTPLLRQVMLGGKPVGEMPRLVDSRTHAAAQLAMLPANLRELSVGTPFQPYPVTTTVAVQELTENARQRHAAA